MKVSINNSTFYVRWKYENPELLKILQDEGIAPEEGLRIMHEEGVPSLLAKLDTIKSLPLPSVTHCIISDGDKNEIQNETVKLHHKDPFSKDKARKYSLAKVLGKMFPADKELRKAFWDAYLTRQYATHKPEVVLH